MKPMCIDLFCGLGGWADGFLAEGYDVIGFDIEQHDYGDGGYPGQLVLQDVLTLHGSQFRSAACIVASPPCQKYSYMAMPWCRAKALIACYEGHPERLAELNALFDACFRIQREASEAAGHHIPLIVENVCGAQRWVGRARWHFGSYYLWGDVPALMPITLGRTHGVSGRKHPTGKVSSPLWEEREISRYSHPSHAESERLAEHLKVPGFRFDNSGRSFQTASVEGTKGIPHRPAGHWTNPAEHERGVKSFTPSGEPLGKNRLARMRGSKSRRRKRASAEIAKIPLTLAQHIARCFRGKDEN